MKRKINFQSSKGHNLCGILSNPSGDKRRPLIVLCHGFTTGKDGRTYVRVEEILIYDFVFSMGVLEGQSNE